MRRIWVGVSWTLEFKSLITRYIDPYFSSVIPYPYSQMPISRLSDDEDDEEHASNSSAVQVQLARMERGTEITHGRTSHLGCDGDR